MIKPGEVWLTVPEAAKRVGRSERTVRRWVTQGRLKCYLGMVNEHAVMLAERDARKARQSARGVVAGQHANDLGSLEGGLVRPRESQEKTPAPAATGPGDGRLSWSRQNGP